ncbi:S-layer homology domain-containing protein [uncultured Phascolarctobacterium sp.]|uniref:S-layer homology domain-containing protein n=1 Tax=uncultured Phascolarctobacterium sp. TaxID=512296 RepID=UPI0025D70733|nr:S-layer homology domain-containing protein [uncultured Phascolarctobacterium sp.]
MKKSLVLAMAMALGVTASAYAANPFSDVPAGHWAYDSINKLAAAGVVEGYGDATFGGDKLMTRYEMAQIVAKAMAKGADVDKLAAEFADELDNLGVRVANLEKKADNVKIAGQIRYEYADRQGYYGDKKGHYAKNRLRSRLYITGQINDDWSYTGRLENNQDLSNNGGDDDTYFNQAYVNGKIGGVKVIAGKADMTLANGNLYDTTAEFVGASYGKDVKVNAYYGKPVDTNVGGYTNYDYEKMFGASLSGKIGKLDLSAGYDKFQDCLAGAGANYTTILKKGEDNAVWNVTAGYAFDKNVKVNATYLNSDVDKDNFTTGVKDSVDTDGYVVGLSYKGANKAKVGSWGAWANYYDQGVGTFVAHTIKTSDWGYFMTEGFKGYNVGVNYALAKNLVYSVDYYDLEGKESDNDTRVIWSRLQINF